MKSDEVSYVEAHGTGTQAGDPLEIASIREVFGGKDRTDILNIGSLKGNIGHAETAAGIASLLKVLAMINNASIPPQASHKSLNPKIPALGADKMAIAQVSKQITTAETESTYPIIISAVSQESVYANAGIISQYLQKITPKPKIGDVAFTLSKRRKLHRQVLITSVSDINTLVQSIKDKAQMPFERQTKRTVDMEKSLYESYPHLKSYIADRMIELESKPNTEKLMSNRAYGLFSQVVHYADFLQGISSITLDKAEAIATIDVSEDARFGLEESTVTQFCDTVAIDTFIQVVGLLINSSTLVTSAEVFVATGVNHVSMSSACDFQNRRSWTVYTKFTSTDDDHAGRRYFRYDM
ncbi:MAG: hypothetical protein Q9163_000211 [Psora crenata]